jgi:hypothetical protein
MNLTNTRGGVSGIGTGRCCAAGAIAALTGLAVLNAGGCNQDEARQAFREASRTELEAGANAILDGLLSGAFAVYDLGDGNGGGDTSGGSTP